MVQKSLNQATSGQGLSNTSPAAADPSLVSASALSAGAIGTTGLQFVSSSAGGSTSATSPIPQPSGASALTTTRAHQLSITGGYLWQLSTHNVDSVKVAVNGVDEYLDSSSPIAYFSNDPLHPDPINKVAPLNPRAEIALYEHVNNPIIHSGHWQQVGATKDFNHINKGNGTLDFTNGHDHYSVTYHAA
jgi:hypothetical protein